MHSTSQTTAQNIAQNIAQTLDQELNVRELNNRRKVVLSSIKTQDKLTPALEHEISQADSKLASKICIYLSSQNVGLF